MKRNGATIRILPLPNVHGVWERDTSDYPDMIKVAMVDGKVINYRRETPQPAPQVLKSIDLIRLMKQNTYGGYKK